MNPQFIQVIIDAVRRDSRRKIPADLTPYKKAKLSYRIRVFTRNTIRDFILLITGIFSAGFGLRGFLLPNNFIDGGATGISLLFAEVLHWELAPLLILVNIPFIFLGYRQISLLFTIRTIFAISGLALVVYLVNYPVITHDKLLVAVFGGFFLGAGIGLAVRGGGVLDGTEVLAIYVSRRTGLTIGDVILIFNIIIFGVAAYLLGVEIALYAILTYLAASKTVDFIIEGIEEYTGVTIISPKSKEIYEMVSQKLGRGITIYKGERGFGKKGHSESERDILYTVITRLEVSRLKTEIEAIDPHAFVIMHSIKDTRGGMIKRRPLSH